ncbi:unnamed protein product [Peronospora belbahrii]|uniref:TerB family tellurite resistance protein n=1 Tax=Peronospora belbahrii TaxID=622444 RepID=A0AAU9KZD1_9STRA|nr:unnamed protein product [Peronospora belbahrii]
MTSLNSDAHFTKPSIKREALRALAIITLDGEFDDVEFDDVEHCGNRGSLSSPTKISEFTINEVLDRIHAVATQACP